MVVFLILGGGGVVAGAIGDGGTIENELYRVGVDEEHPYSPAVEAHGPLRTVSPDANAEVRVVGDEIEVGSDERSQAAFAELRQALQQYNELRLREEPDEAAAFPVVVEVQFVETAGPSVIEQATTTPQEPTGQPADETNDTEADEGDPENDTATTPTEPAAETDDSGTPVLPAIGDRVLPESTTVGTPAELSPPFPFSSLILAFLFLIPLNFVVQAYGSTVLDERINNRGEALLISPATPREIVIGKTLPYGLAAAVFLGGIAGLLGVGIFSAVGVVTLAGLFLAATFVSGVVARSYQELTFLTVAISVVGTTYAFVPAIFTDVTPVALISPLTLVVRDLEGQPVGLIEGLVSVTPTVTAAVVLFWFGLGIYRAESLFSQRAPRRKALEMLAARSTRSRDIGLVTIALLPLVVLLQLLALAVLFVVPTAVALPVMLVLVSIIEEIAKSIHVYAAYRYERFDRSLRTAGTLGMISGGAFFLGETAIQLLQLAGLTEVDLAQTIIAPAGLAGPVALVVLAVPLVIHVLTAVLAAIGARGSRRSYLTWLGVAVIVHTAYNAGVIALVG